MSKEEACAHGLPWYEEKPVANAGNALAPEQIPDSVPSEDTTMLLNSASSARAFSVTAQELRRYRKLEAPLPRLTYDERMEKRAGIIGGMTLFDRTCAKTGKPIRTTIPPEAPWIVWDKEVYEEEFSS